MHMALLALAYGCVNLGLEKILFAVASGAKCLLVESVAHLNFIHVSLCSPSYLVASGKGVPGRIQVYTKRMKREAPQGAAECVRRWP
jgi:hypothetical protein